MEITKEHKSLTTSLRTIDKLQLLEKLGLVFLKGVTPEGLITLQGFVPHPRVFKQHKLYLMILK